MPGRVRNLSSKAISSCRLELERVGLQYHSLHQYL
jgi:hypothetical protein